MRSLAVSAPKPSGQRRQARKHLILSRQEGRQESKQERLENKDGMRAEARKEALFIKKSERAENKAEAKEERNDNRIAAINARQVSYRYRICQFLVNHAKIVLQIFR